jgi:hypothetical protein
MAEFNRTLFERGMDIIPDIVAGDANADLAGDWVGLKNYDRAYLVIIKPAGSAGDDLAIHLQQATAAAGTGAKDLNWTRLWYKKGSTNDFSAVATWTAVTLATAASDVDLDGAATGDLALDSSGAVIIVEVMADSLDVDGGFDWVNNIIEGDDVANALVLNQFWILCGGRFPQSIPLTAIS